MSEVKNMIYTVGLIIILITLIAGIMACMRVSGKYDEAEEKRMRERMREQDD